MAGTLLKYSRQGSRILSAILEGSNKCQIYHVGQRAEEALGSMLSVQGLQSPGLTTVSCIIRHFHSSASHQKGTFGPREPQRWPRYNDIVYPPRPQNEPLRVAEVFHHRSNIKYSYKKMWYIASLIRGKSIDEAIKQLKFVERDGARMLTEVLREAQEKAVKEHNVEYKSNLWVAESFVGKAYRVRSMRKHRGFRFGTINYGYIHYFVCLREGQPPEHYYTPLLLTGGQHFEEYIEQMRDRRIRWSL